MELRKPNLQSLKPLHDKLKEGTQYLWTKVEEKVPAARYLRGFWMMLVIYLAILACLAVGVILAGAIQGTVGIGTAAALLLSFPIMMVVSLLTSPVLVAQVGVQVALCTILSNAVTNIVQRRQWKEALVLAGQDMRKEDKEVCDEADLQGVYS